MAIPAAEIVIDLNQADLGRPLCSPQLALRSSNHVGQSEALRY